MKYLILFLYGMRNKKTCIYFILIISHLHANIPQTLKNQSNVKAARLHYHYKKSEKSKIQYIYDSTGNKTVSLNFNRYGNIISKTFYNISGKKKNYIYKDDCEIVDCDFFIH
tara:strand:- start:276 stop:611 length:336 start_codon:yes stop_codon:yes gene_type:complete